MKPLRLEIEGFTAFRERQVVDFTDLDLFVITGPTGSGKSSLLDAITLALYGNVVRTGHGELKELISHGIAHAKVQLDFEVEGVTYRVTRRLSRGAAQQAAVDRIEGGVEMAEVERGGVRPANERLVEIVGLDFGAFTKAVLLPQGEFHQFLKGDAKDRREILVRLMDLERFRRAGDRARSLAKELGGKAASKEEVLTSSFADATPERVAELAGVAEQARTRHEATAGVQERVQGQARLLEAVEARLAAIDGTRERVTRQAEELRALAVLREELAPKAEGIAAERTASAEALEAAEKGREDALAALSGVSARTGDEATLERLRNALSAVRREEGTIAAKGSEAARLADDLKAAGAELKAAEKAEDRARKDHEAAAAREREARDRQAAAREAAERSRALDVARDDSRTAARTVAELERRQKEAKARTDELAAAAEESAARARHLDQEHAAAALRAGLEAGEPCPVCRRILDEVPETEADLEEAIREARIRAEADGKALAAVRGEAARLEGQLATAREHAARADAKLAEMTAAAGGDAAVEAQPELGLAADGSEVAAATSEEEAARAGLQAAVAAATDARGRVTRLTAERAAADAAMVEARERYGQAEKVLGAGFPGGVPGDPEGAIASREKELTGARAAMAAADDVLSRARARRDAAERAAAEQDHRLADLARRATRVDTLLDEVRTAATAFSDGEAPPARPPAPDGTEDLLPALAAWSDSLGAFVTERRAVVARELEEGLGALAALVRTAGVEGRIAGPEAAVREVSAALARDQRALVSAEERHRALVADLERREKLATEVAGLRERAVRYKALGDELKDNRFIDFLIEESLVQLAAFATMELRTISGDRYSLSAREKSFVVVDHANADEERSVTTLSGGETFLASLSLALGLSRGLEDIAGVKAASRLQAIFIDEGFGALDPETLEVVVEALERLREGARMVGVISHVPLLAERIPTGLEVRKEPGGSRVVPR